MEKERVSYFDVYRGIAIIIMVMGHVGFGKSFDHYIHAFHMPMWFFISGYFFKDKGNSFWEFVYLRAKKLLIPYAFFAALYYLIIVNTVDTSRGLIHLGLLKKYILFNHEGLPISGVFWFVTSLLVSDCLFLGFRRLIKSEKLFLTVILFCTMVGFVFSKHGGTRLPWTADTSLVALLFYYIGYAMKHTEEGARFYESFMHMNAGWALILLVVNGYLVMKTAYVNLRSATYPNAILFYFNAVVGTIAWLKLSFAMNEFDNYGLHVINRMLCFIGANTMGYLFLNQLVIKYLKLVLPYQSVMEQMVILILCMLLITVFTKLLLKTSMKIFIGK